jgi:hypothetical protein
MLKKISKEQLFFDYDKKPLTKEEEELIRELKEIIQDFKEEAIRKNKTKEIDGIGKDQPVSGLFIQLVIKEYCKRKNIESLSAEKRDDLFSCITDILDRSGYKLHSSIQSLLVDRPTPWDQLHEEKIKRKLEKEVNRRITENARKEEKEREKEEIERKREKGLGAFIHPRPDELKDFKKRP